MVLANTRLRRLLYKCVRCSSSRGDDHQTAKTTMQRQATTLLKPSHGTWEEIVGRAPKSVVLALKVVFVGIVCSLSTEIGFAHKVPPHNISVLWPTTSILFAVLVVAPGPRLVGILARSVLHVRHQSRLLDFGDVVPGGGSRECVHRRCRRPSVRRWRSQLRQPSGPYRLYPFRGCARAARLCEHCSLRGRKRRLLVLLARVVSFRGARIPDAGSGASDLVRSGRSSKKFLSRVSWKLA